MATMSRKRVNLQHSKKRNKLEVSWKLSLRIYPYDVPITPMYNKFIINKVVVTKGQERKDNRRWNIKNIKRGEEK